MTLGRLAVLAGMLTVLAPRAAAAQSDATRARELFERSVTLMQNEDWGAALVQLEESFRLHPTQVALFDIGLCLKGLRRYGEAIAAFERLVTEFAYRGTAARIALARVELEQLRARFGTVRVDVRPAGAEVLVDGALVGTAPLGEALALTGGPHLIQARLAGHEAAERRVAVVVGADAAVELELRPSPAPPLPEVVVAPPRRPPLRPRPPGRAPEPAPHRAGLRPIWFWSAVTLTGAGVVTTAILGGLVVQSDADYKDSRIRLASDRDDGKRLALFADVALSVTVASAVAAVLLYASTSFGATGDDRAVRPMLLAFPSDRGLGLALTGAFR